MMLPKSRGSDTDLDQAHPNAEHGGRKYPRLKSGSFKSLVHLPIPTGTLGQTISSASLTFQVRGSWPAQTVTVKPASESWSAATANWGNQPGVLSTSATATTGALSDGAQVTVDVTSLLQDVASGTKWYGFVLSTSTGTLSQVYGFDSGQPSWTLTVETEENPDPPTALRPNGSVVGDSEPTAVFDFDDIASIQFQVDSGNNGSIDYTSGWLATATPRYSLASPLTITAGTVVAYRINAKNSAGFASGYSDWATYTYQPAPTLTLDSPAAGVIWDATTDVLAHLSTTHLDRFRVRVTAGNDRTKVRYDSHVIAASDPSNIALELPEFNEDGTRVLRDDNDYQINVRAWDDYDREAVPGYPEWVEVWTTVHFDDDLTLTPIATITAKQIGVTPQIRVTWTRAAAPDSWLVYRGSELVERLDPSDVVSGVSMYSWVDKHANPAVKHVYSVRAVTSGVGRSAAGPRASITTEVEDVWLVRDNGDMAMIAGCDVTQLKQAERRLVYKLGRLPGEVSITTAYEGLVGPLTGGWCAADEVVYRYDQDKTLATLDSIKSNTGEVVRLLYGDVSKPVTVHDIDVKPHQLWQPLNNIQSVELSISQAGEFDYRVG